MNKLFIPKFNTRQLDKLSDMASDVALISLAVVVLPAVLDKFNVGKVILGLVGTIVFAIISLWLKK